MLNANIRRVKEKYGLTLAEMAYEQIQLHIKVTKNNFSFQYAHGQIVIDLDNQEYIIVCSADHKAQNHSCGLVRLYLSFTLPHEVKIISREVIFRLQA